MEKEEALRIKLCGLEVAKSELMVSWSQGLSVTGKRHVDDITADVKGFAEFVRAKKKAKAISVECSAGALAAAARFTECIADTSMEALQDKCAKAYVDYVDWAETVVKADSLTIKLRNGSTGQLCEAEVDDRAKAIQEADEKALANTPGKVLLFRKAGAEAMKKIKVLIKVYVKLFIAKKNNTQAHFEESESKLVDKAKEMLESLGIFRLCIQEREEQLNRICLYVQQEMAAAREKFATTAADIITKYYMKADARVQPDEREIKSVKASILSSGLAPAVIEALESVMEMRIDSHTKACMDKSTATSVIGRLLANARALSVAIPELIQSKVLQDEDKDGLQEMIKEQLQELSEAAVDKLDPFEQSIKKVRKPAEGWLNKCPDVMEDEKGFVEYLLKRKSDADKAVMFQKEIEQALEFYTLEVNNLPADLADTLFAAEPIPSTKLLLEKIKGILMMLAMVTIMRNPATKTPQGATFRKDLKDIVSSAADAVKKEEDLQIPAELLKEATDISVWSVKSQAQAAGAENRGRGKGRGRGAGRGADEGESAPAAKAKAEPAPPGAAKVARQTKAAAKAATKAAAKRAAAAAEARAAEARAEEARGAETQGDEGET